MYIYVYIHVNMYALETSYSMIHFNKNSDITWLDMYPKFG